MARERRKSYLTKTEYETLEPGTVLLWEELSELAFRHDFLALIVSKDGGKVELAFNAADRARFSGEKNS
jgi:hypothetical protein